MAHIYRGIIPFVLLQLVGLVLMIVFPELRYGFPDRWASIFTWKYAASYAVQRGVGISSTRA